MCRDLRAHLGADASDVYVDGTRTVDVHIRRIRSKVGPQIAAHITTVRGVGYLFKD